MALREVHVEREPRESIADLFGRVKTEGTALAKAHVEVVKQTALDKVDKAKLGVGLLVAAGLLAYAAIIVFFVSMVFWLADLVGPLLAGLIVTAFMLVVAFVMVKVGTGRLVAMKSDGKLS